MLEGVSVVRSEKVKDELVLDGNDIELVSRSCALINQVNYPLYYMIVSLSIFHQCKIEVSLDTSVKFKLILCSKLSVLLIFLPFYFSLHRNAMSRTRISENSSMVSMSVRKAKLTRKNKPPYSLLVYLSFILSICSLILTANL